MVRDDTGAVIPGAAVVATNVDTNVARETKTDDMGNYRLLALAVGRYRLEATANGFQKSIVTDIVLSVNDQRQIDFAMKLGSISSTIEVVANAVAVETTSTQLGEVIEEKKLLSLPLNGRSYVDLLGLQAGVAPGSVGSTGGTRNVSGSLSAGSISVNGQRETANAFLVNGGDVSEGRNMGTAVIPNLDSVAEFRLVTNSFDAEYGRFSGSVMNAVTKGGNNAFHGSAFEFLRNDKLDSRRFFDPGKGALKRNQFGYTLGGPFIKNKLFWFTDYQGTREVEGLSTGHVPVPTAAQRSGQFDPDALSGTVNGAYWAQALSQRLGYTVTDKMPYSFAGCTSTADCVFPGGVIPAAAFSTPAVRMMKYIPEGNVGDGTYATAGANKRVNDDKAGQRVDIPSTKLGAWSIYYFFDESSTFNPLSSSFPGMSDSTPTRAQQAVLSNTLTIGPTAVNEARVSFHRMATRMGQPSGGKATLDELGFVTGVGTLGIIKSGPPDFEGVPPVGFNDFSFGRAVGTTGQYDNTWHASDNFTKVHGAHTLKFGGEFRYLQVNERNIYAPNGQFSFNGEETGNDFADYLLGAPAEYVQSSVQMLDSRTRYGGVFAQDSWKIRPNFTLNLGLRWDASMPWYDTQDKIETIVPGLQSVVYPTSPRGWVFPGDPGVARTLAPTEYNNFAPRVGFAYSPNHSDGFLGKLFGGPGKTSIRAAWGMYYTAIEDLTMFIEVGDAPYGLYWTSSAPPMFETPFLTRKTGESQRQRFPFIFPTPGDKTIDFSQFTPISYAPGYAIWNRQPYAEHYNFTIQRQLSPSTTLTLGYVGNQGHRLLTQVEANPGNAALCMSLTGSGVMPGTPECGPNGENETYTRPDGTKVYGTRGPLGPNFGNDAFEWNIANSTYNSLQVTVERKAADLTFLGAYTYGKSMDNASGFWSYTNFSNYALSRSLSSFDVTHNFVMSYVYSLPFGRLFGGPRRLVDGWTIGGITRFSTGFPIGLRQSGDRTLAGTSGVDMPDLVGPVEFLDPRQGNHQYVSKSAFAIAPIGRFGTANRMFFHGPGFNNFDMSLSKMTRITEQIGLQFRAEFFNAFNHAQFTNPSGNVSSGSFGRITDARAPRIGQLSLKVQW